MGLGARGRTSSIHRVLWWAFGRVPLLWSDASHARLDERSTDRTSVSTHILAVLRCRERPVQWYMRSALAFLESLVGFILTHVAALSFVSLWSPLPPILWPHPLTQARPGPE